MSESRAYVDSRVPLLRDGLAVLVQRSGFALVNDPGESDVLVRSGSSTTPAPRTNEVIVGDDELTVRVFLRASPETRARLARLVEHLLRDDAGS